MKNPTALTEWFAKEQEVLSITAEEVGIENVADWNLVEKDGAPHHIAHVSGNYHRGVFLKAWDRAREVFVDRFMIAPIGKQALYGIALLARYDGRYLMQAKAEPGNDTPGHVQLTTTIQASHINISEGKSGAIAFTEFYEHPACRGYVVSQDGAQLYMKKNKVCFLDLTEDPGALPEHFTWATLDEIEALAAEGLVSEHVMQCLGVAFLSGLKAL